MRISTMPKDSPHFDPKAIEQAGRTLDRAKERLKLALEAVEGIEPPTLIPIRTVDEGVELLGGTAVVGRLTGATMQQVSDWKRDGFFATNTFHILREALAEIGYYATPALWRMKERGPKGPAVQSVKDSRGRGK